MLRSLKKIYPLFTRNKIFHRPKSSIAPEVTKLAKPTVFNVNELKDSYFGHLTTEERALRTMTGIPPFFSGSFKEDDESLKLYQAGIESTNENKFVGRIKLHTEGESIHEKVQRLQKNKIFACPSDLYKHLQAAKRDIPVKNLTDLKNHFAGLPVMRSCQSDGSKKIIPFPLNEVSKVNVIISLGLDIADTEKGVSAGIREFNKLLFNVSEPEKIPGNVTQFAYWPSLNRYQRYRDGLLYYFDNCYLSTHADTFVSNYLVPRIFSKEGSLLPPSKVKPLLLCGYSLGARDNALYLNAYAYHLSTYFNLSNEIIDLYLQRIFRLNIGAAVKWDKDFELTSPSLNFLSRNDMDILKPLDLYQEGYANPALTDKPVYVLHRPSKRTIKEYLVMLEHGQVPGSYFDEQQKLKSNPLGHSLVHYVEGIQRSSAAKYLDLPRLFLDENRIKITEHALFKESRPYKIGYELGIEGIKALEQQWTKYLTNEKAIEQKAAAHMPKSSEGISIEAETKETPSSFVSDRSALANLSLLRRGEVAPCILSETKDSLHPSKNKRQ